MGRATTIFSAVFLAIGGFLFGFDSGIITSTIALPTFVDYFGKPSDSTTGGIVSAFQGGAIPGPSSTCSRPIGSADDEPSLPARLSRRFPLAFQTLSSLILLIGIFFLNESPRWLMEKDKHEDARAVLNSLRSGQDQELIELELQEIRDVIIADRAIGEVSWKSILTRPTWRKRLLLRCGIQAFGPLSGINVINYYGSRMYGILGISAQTSLMIIGISGALSIVYCTIGLRLLEKLGRIKPLIVSAAGLAAALLVNAVQGQYFNADNGNQLRSMVAMNFVFSLFYTPLGNTSWVYPAEILPVEVRALGNAITTFTNWTVNLIFAQFTPDALTAIEFRYFYVFFVFNVTAMLCYIFFYPETKGRTLEQMDELFGDQLVPHAMKDPVGARAAMAKAEATAQEVE
ncbi:hypothetical protein VTI74DRAFT_10777 [Chaetomium olivicolor]